jgi:hypothetical protein
VSESYKDLGAVADHAHNRCALPVYLAADIKLTVLRLASHDLPRGVRLLGRYFEYVGVQ